MIPTIEGKWTDFYANLAGAIRGEVDLAITAESVFKTMQVIEAVITSSKTGNVVLGSTFDDEHKSNL